MSRSAHFTVVGRGMEGVLLEVEGDAQRLGEVVGEVLVGGPQVSTPPVQFSRTVPANSPHCPPPLPPVQCSRTVLAHPRTVFAANKILYYGYLGDDAMTGS
jgi:hypothetical protein